MVLTWNNFWNCLDLIIQHIQSIFFSKAYFIH